MQTSSEDCEGSLLVATCSCLATLDSEVESSEITCCCCVSFDPEGRVSNRLNSSSGALVSTEGVTVMTCSSLVSVD